MKQASYGAKLLLLDAAGRGCTRRSARFQCQCSIAGRTCSCPPLSNQYAGSSTKSDFIAGNFAVFAATSSQHGLASVIASGCPGLSNGGEGTGLSIFGPAPTPVSVFCYLWHKLLKFRLKVTMCL